MGHALPQTRPTDMSADGASGKGEAHAIPGTENLRRFIFLNHANPQDNAFVLWLGSRLTAAGYDVWSDLLQLTGGERFWKDIDEAIRQHSAVFLPILSNTSIDPSKEGVHNEIAIATDVRRKENLDTFMVPLRLEGISALPPTLVQMNWIDFSGNWANGLSLLLKRLEKSSVPRRSSPERQAMDAWAKCHVRLAGSIVREPETLQSNWFQIQELPASINFYASPASKEIWARAIDALPFPRRAYLRLVATFASHDAVQEATGPDVPAKPEYSVPTDSFLQGEINAGGPPVSARDARNMITDILRQGWEIFAKRAGLERHETSSGTCWYVPEGLLEKNKAKFRDGAGKAKWRMLTGVKGQRKIRWHFALSMKPALNDPFRMVARTHLVFSEDTKSLVTDSKRALRLRKWLCKGWWNDDFRDRLLGLTAVLSDHQPTFLLPLGGGATASIAASPLTFASPVSYQRHSDQPSDVADSNDDLDEESRPFQPDDDDDIEEDDRS